MDMSQYLELFLSESREHLQSLNDLVLVLEGSPSDQDAINSLFRAAHSLKGMAASMGYNPIAELAHKMEDLMFRVREGELPFESGIAGLLFEGADLLSLLLNDVAEGRPFEHDIGTLVQRLTTYTPSTAGAEPPLIPPPEPPEAGQAPQIHHSQPNRESFQTVRVKTEILERLIDTTGELFTTKHRLQDISRDLSLPRLNDSLHDLTRLLRELHEMVMHVRLMPFSSIAERFPRLVRELAQKSGKEVSFVVEGRGIELDRGILEELADPLIHILRNAVDHGLETSSERKAAGKDAFGRLKLSACREKDHVVVAVEDDGRGMDPERLVSIAVQKGIVTAEDGSRFSPRDAFMLTCLPGFSTAEKVTDISGRGVGMDAVRATIQSLGGTLAIESEKGDGSRITLTLPLTIAIINVFLLKVSSLTIAVPVTGVLRTVELKREQVLLRGTQVAFLLDDEDIPLVSLKRMLGLPLSPSAHEFLPVIVTEVKGRRIGVAVDRVMGQREVHVKPMGRPLSRLRGLAGAAILGDGEAIFLLDLATML